MRNCVSLSNQYSIHFGFSIRKLLKRKHQRTEAEKTTKRNSNDVFTSLKKKKKQTKNKHKKTYEGYKQFGIDTSSKKRLASTRISISC